LACAAARDLLAEIDKQKAAKDGVSGEVNPGELKLDSDDEEIREKLGIVRVAPSSTCCTTVAHKAASKSVFLMMLIVPQCCPIHSSAYQSQYFHISASCNISTGLKCLAGIRVCLQINLSKNDPFE